MIVRSCFNRFNPHPHEVEGYGSVQLVQRTDDFVEAWDGGRLDSYAFLVHERLVPAR